MVAKLIALFLCLCLIMPINVPAASVEVPVTVTYSAKPHHHHHDNGKHKGYHKGKHNPHGGHSPGHSGQHNPHSNPPQHHAPAPHNKPAPQPAPQSAPRNQGPGPVQRQHTPKTHIAPPTTKPDKPKCKVIVKPTERTVIVKEVPRTNTTVEKVFYGAGVLTAVATGVAVLMLLIGFGVGWYRRKQNEQKFLDEVLNKDE